MGRHDLWVGLKIKASLPGKLWVSFPLQVVAEGQLLGDDDTGTTPSASFGGRASVVGVMSDPALSSFSSTALDSPPSPLSSSSSATLRSARRRSIRGSAPGGLQPDLAAPMYRSADETTLRGHQTLRSRNSKFNRLSRTFSATISKNWFNNNTSKDHTDDEQHSKP
jgi:hypothetical protein